MTMPILTVDKFQNYKFFATFIMIGIKIAVFEAAESNPGTYFTLRCKDLDTGAEKYFLQFLRAKIAVWSVT